MFLKEIRREPWDSKTGARERRKCKYTEEKDLGCHVVRDRAEGGARGALAPPTFLQE